MGRHAKTQALIDEAASILDAGWPMTVRQVYYQLVSRQVIENNRGRYQAVCDALVAARREGLIPWKWIEDRLRQPRHVAMWAGLADFAVDLMDAYRRDVWASQDGYLECWLEKDALSGIFADALHPYGVTLNVGRGYDGWASIRNAADRYGDGAGVTVLYCGDFDPSGEDMVRSLRERLADLGSEPDIVKVALTYDDISRYQLPPDFTKASDTRSAAFVARFGDVAVELDALPADVLRQRLRTEVESRMDLAKLAEVRETETRERARLTALLQWAA
jgi:hypothetical protein